MAGFLTVVAGGIGYFATRHSSKLAFSSAELSASVGLRGIRETIQAQQREAEAVRLFAFRRSVFEGVIESAFQALMTISQLGNIDASIVSSLEGMKAGVPSLAKLHLVSDTKTADSIMTALNAIIVARNHMILERVNLHKNPPPKPKMFEAALRLAASSTQQTNSCTTAFVEMIVNIRRELGIVTDASRYAEVLQRITEMTGEQTLSYIRELNESWRA